VEISEFSIADDKKTTKGLGGIAILRMVRILPK